MDGEFDVRVVEGCGGGRGCGGWSGCWQAESELRWRGDGKATHSFHFGDVKVYVLAGEVAEWRL